MKKMKITTSDSYYVCPNCEETFKTPIRGTTSTGEEMLQCPYCNVLLRVGHYEVY